MLRHTLSLVTLLLISMFSLGLQSASHAQTVGGIFKISPSNDYISTVKVNAYYNSTGVPTGSFYVGNSDWNFSGNYQYTTLGCKLTFTRDMLGNVISADGYCYGTLYNAYYSGSHTKVMARTTFSSVLGIGSFSVTLYNYTTNTPILTYSGMSTASGWMTLTN